MRQTQALAVLLAGESVFLTGPPGSGKTYVLNEFIGRATRAGKTIAVTASTGIAATHINGTTIHSWSGLGVRDFLTETDLSWLSSNERLVKRYNAADTLVIDEISMLHGSRLDMVNMVAQLLRADTRPFGGMQVVLVGDLFQLPPVSPGSTTFDFAHMSQAWQELAPKICYLTEQHRQQEDELLDLLVAMRQNNVRQRHMTLLQERLDTVVPTDQAITRLYTHNVDVEAINDRQLAQLSADTQTFRMQTSGSKPRIEGLIRSVLAPEILLLKEGAEVMFVANNFPLGFANGTRGQVVGFSRMGNWPQVELTSNHRVVTVEPHSWSMQEDGRIRAEVSQIPLRLAWAITIHKSQGMSLDAAEIDLSKSFTPGMGYVALSRVRSINGVYLAGINRQALRLHTTMFEFDAQLRSASDELAYSTTDVGDEVIPSTDDITPRYDVALYETLKSWRQLEAKSASVPPYVVAHDTVLQALAMKPPQNLQQLLAIKGFGPAKVKRYGEAILATLGAYLAVK